MSTKLWLNEDDPGMVFENAAGEQMYCVSKTKEDLPELRELTHDEQGIFMFVMYTANLTPEKIALATHQPGQLSILAYVKDGTLEKAVSRWYTDSMDTLDEENQRNWLLKNDPNWHVLGDYGTGKEKCGCPLCFMGRDPRNKNYQKQWGYLQQELVDKVQGITALKQE